MTDPFAELREHRADLIEMFASKGWDIWQQWAKTQIAGHFEAAIHGPSAEEREHARLTGIALERFSKLPIFLMQQAETPSVDEAPTIP